MTAITSFPEQTRAAMRIDGIVVEKLGHVGVEDVTSSLKVADLTLGNYKLTIK